jgi:hypothetical protein
MLLAQNGVCAACFKTCSIKKNLAVDHDHKTGKVRGLLCQNCNVALGHARENPDVLRRLAEYLTNPLMN